MGNARWSQSDWAQHSQAASTKTRQEIFTRQGLVDTLNPAKIKFRESVDSKANPNSTPIILAADETGSMGELAEVIIKTGLGTVMRSIYDHKPVTDPHICCMGIGDAYTDEAPLQVTQFEASVDPLVKQVSDIYIEGNGGGNGGESYGLAWWFAAYKVKQDAVGKRSKKGYLFTIGDECIHPLVTREQVRKVCGVGCERDVPIKELLGVVQKFWHVYHLIVKPVDGQDVVNSWRNLLSERAVMVRNHEKLAEIIVTIISLNEGADADVVKADFDDDTVRIVEDATKLLTVGA